MSALFTARLDLPTRLDGRLVLKCEAIFSELLDVLATSHQRIDEKDWEIEALFDFEPDAAVINSMLASIFEEAAMAPVPVIVSCLEDRDWLGENRVAFPPLRIGRFWVYGSHVGTPPPPATLPLHIDAAMAFGSGTHPTTKGCLLAMQMIRHKAPERILDMGCGSAILAMAAGRLWPFARLVAADNDPTAIRVAATNRALNHIAPNNMRLAVSSGFGNRLVRQQAPYDLILANILAGPLMRMAPELVPHLHRKGWLVISGILKRQAIAVELSFAAQGLRKWSYLQIDNWITLIMRPASTGQMPRLWRGIRYNDG